MTQDCHLLHESANELVASHSSFVGWFPVLFLCCFGGLFLPFFGLLLIGLCTGPSSVLFCGPQSADGLAY